MSTCPTWIVTTTPDGTDVEQTSGPRRDLPEEVLGSVALVRCLGSSSGTHEGRAGEFEFWRDRVQGPAEWTVVQTSGPRLIETEGPSEQVEGGGVRVGAFGVRALRGRA